MSRFVPALFFVLACGSSPTTGGGGPAFGGDGGASFAFDEGGVNTIPQGCVNLECQQHNRNTHITGIVYDPKGTLPLYNVYVYVPNAPLDPITTGPVCTACQARASGKPLSVATTDETGRFELTNVPDGDDIPLVLQIGKWRRRVTLPHVAIAKNNTFNTKLDPHDTTHEQMIRLPKRQAEGSPDDNIPLIAVTTGACDYGECFLMNTIGIDENEFEANGRVHVFDGQGGETARPKSYGTSANLFGDAKTLAQYDLVFVSCECSTFDRGSGYANVENYLNAGGRFFGTHYAYNFFANQTQCAVSAADATCKGPSDFNSVAGWKGDDGSSFYAPPYVIDTSFPKGQSFATWLVNVQGGTPGEIDLRDTRGDVDMVADGKATRWIYTTNPNAGNPTNAYSTVYLTFNTPVGQAPENQCGRAVFSDVHVAGTSTGFCASQDPDYASNLAALEFLFFDLSSCVQNDSKAPIAPPN
jgi:hypothetical protein